MEQQLETATAKQHLEIGVLLMDNIQLLDAAPVDLFSILSYYFLKPRGIPDSITSLAPSVNITYISPTYDKHLQYTFFQSCTADAALRVTRSISSPDVAPGKLDILVIPGPDPWVQITPVVGEFVRGHAAKREKTVVMSVCVGVNVAAQAGILDGKTATGTGALIPDLKKRYKKVNWVTKRWASDGNIWTSGTITNGNDMIAAFLRQTYPSPLAEAVCSIADVGDRDQDFPPQKKGLGDGGEGEEENIEADQLRKSFGKN